jgi:two-component system cell cycle sensor histidine kinase/response regulator CckA
MMDVKCHELSKTRGKDSPVVPRNPGLLIVDDLDMILTWLKFELEPKGFTVFLAADGDDAIHLYRRHRGQIDLVLLDVQMAGMDGPTTLAILQMVDPDVLACFMTGNSGMYTNEDLLERGAASVLDKPFSADELIRHLHEVLSERRTPEIR